MCFSSGLAATMNVVSLLTTGDHIITIDDVYGGTGRLFRAVGKTAGLITDFLDFSNDITKLTAALKPTTKVYIISIRHNFSTMWQLAIRCNYATDNADHVHVHVRLIQTFQRLEG